MQLVSSFVRSDEARTPSIFVPIATTRGRPQVNLRVRVSSEVEAEEANKNHVTLFALTSRTVTALGYPIRFPTQLVVARSVLPAVETTLRTIPFVSEEAAARPRIEDIAVALLSFDPVVARVILERNREDVDPDYLLKRVLTENVERLAASVRFFDLAPALPRIGKPISTTNLERELVKNPPTGRLP